MKKLISFFMFLVFFTGMVSSAVSAAVPEPPVVSSQSVMMLNARTGEKIYSKKSDTRIKTDTILPILISLAVKERKGLDEFVLVSESPEETQNSSSSNTMKLYSGEKMKIRDLITIVLLSGDDDAVISLASAVSGSEEEFAAILQEKASQLKMTDTKIKGILKSSSSEDYTTVSDIALAMMELSRNEDLLKIAGETSVNFTPTNIAPEVRTLDNTNLQIYTQTQEYYEKAVAGIVSPEETGGSYVSVAADKDQMFIVALSDTENPRDVYKNSKVLFDYGFNNFITKKLIPAGTKLQEWPLRDGTMLDLVTARDFYFTVERGNAALLDMSHSINFKPREISGDVFTRGEEMGLAEVIVDSHPVGEIPLLSARDVELKPQTEAQNTDEYVSVRTWITRLLLTAALGAILIMIIRVWNKMRRSKVKQARLKKRRSEYIERKKTDEEDL